MKILRFYSNRIEKFVAVVMTYEKVYYITEDDEVISVKRDSCWHFNNDGVDRTKDYFEDPRFDYWTGNK